MKLFFLRHGLAGDREEWKNNDFKRPLTKEGRARMKREAANIAELKVEPDLILTSPLVRAYQTAEIVAKELDLMDKLVKDDRLAPGFRQSELFKIVRAHSDASALLLVGHEPDFSAVITYLIGGGRVTCKKGSLAYVDLPDSSHLRGELIWLIPPKMLAL